MPIYSNTPYRPRSVSISIKRRKKRTRPIVKRRVSPYVKSLVARRFKRRSGYRKKNMMTGLKRSIRKHVRENKSTENQVISLTVPRPRPSVFKLAMSSMEPCWFRCQGLTQYDTTSGFYPIAQRVLTGGSVSYPIHVWALTAFPNINGAGSLVTPNIGYAMGFSSTANTATVTSNILPSVSAAGATISTSPLQLENYPGVAAATYVPYRKMFHEWTNVKMNLYGTRSRATRYTCELVQTNDSSAVDFLSGKDPVKQADYIDYLSRPYIYNNINMGDVQSRKYHKVIKSYDVTIDPIQLTDYAGSNSVPHMQTVNWFIKHNKIRRYDWLDDVGQSAHTLTPNFEQNLQGTQTNVEEKYRLYLVLRALSPSVDVTKVNIGDTPNPDIEPSYDLCLRQKVYFNS